MRVKDIRRGRRWCHVLDNSNVVLERCTKENGFFCEVNNGRELYPPVLKLEYTYPLEKAFEGGELLRIVCLGFVDHRGYLFFVMRDGATEKHLDATHTDVTLIEDATDAPRLFSAHKQHMMCTRDSSSAVWREAAAGLVLHAPSDRTCGSNVSARRLNEKQED
ncbi:hypothetical protein RRG08_013815 [Elysia crispata]|uniref:Uncharacterized protein n=1 Tax=Elysia crispata TaxID=231223 RepID=A0AAE1BDF9_9GAST|nr:hypothetical protein RRG08_013815 [Elysia crispata]